VILLGLACSPEDVGCTPRETGEEPTEVTEPEHVPDPPVEPRGTGRAIEHTLRFEDAQNHYFSVESVFPAEGEELELMLAVWTPGSYLVREYARHFENVRATDLEGNPLTLEKVRKNRWVVRAEEGELPPRVVVRFEAYANELTVRTNFVDADFASIHGAPTYLTIVDDLARPHDVRFELPETWSGSYTGLAPVRGEEHRYAARDYDELVDSPVVLGNPSVVRMQVGGTPHYLVSVDGHGVFDEEKAAADIRRIIAAEQRFWGVVPYERYYFLNLLTGGGGGLEHRNSTQIIGDRWITENEEQYRRWLGLVSHEFFHTWNVKLLRPEPLGPFDYENENYVRDLWVVEGITSYYDDLLLRRAGVLTREQYLAVLTETIERQQSAWGRRVQSLSESSFDAWIKYYRPDENFSNARISYYRKGTLVAWLLDMEIRRVTENEQSLDDVMRLMYERFPSEDRGFTPEEFRAVAAEIAEVDLAPFFRAAVDGTGELDYEAGLRVVGLQFEKPESDDEESEDQGPRPAHLGLSAEGNIVRSVEREGPAWEAGVNPGDELIAIDGERITDLDAHLGLLHAGDEVELLVARRGRLRTLEVTLGAPASNDWTVEVNPDASPAVRRVYESWVGPAEVEAPEEEELPEADAGIEGEGSETESEVEAPGADGDDGETAPEAPTAESMAPAAMTPTAMTPAATAAMTPAPMTPMAPMTPAAMAAMTPAAMAPMTPAAMAPAESDTAP